MGGEEGYLCVRLCVSLCVCVGVGACVCVGGGSVYVFLHILPINKVKHIRGLGFLREKEFKN